MQLAVLPGGKVFLVSRSQDAPRYIYDPATNSWEFLRTGAANFVLTLQDGRVLLGGQDECVKGKAPLCATAEFFDPTTKMFSPTAGDFPFMVNRPGIPQLQQLPCGLVVVVGERDAAPIATLTFDPKHPGWNQISEGPTRLTEAARSLILPDGRMLVTHGTVISTSESPRFFPLFLE